METVGTAPAASTRSRSSVTTARRSRCISMATTTSSARKPRRTDPTTTEIPPADPQLLLS
jgi:hypothetical protein